MIRKIIQIDEDKCNGCGACASACHEDAIAVVGGKARLLRDDYCDGLGNCLPACPAGAITFIEREAEAFNEEAVKAAQQRKAQAVESAPAVESQISNWPVQIKLLPARVPYLVGADLLVAADCTAYAYGDFHNRFLRGRKLLVGCPKLDAVDYAEKLSAVFRLNDIKSVTVLRMEVPCCGGLEYAVKTALRLAEKDVLCEVVTVSVEGKLL